MPKKSAGAHHGAQRNRNKPKVQKSFELVRPEKVETEVEESSTASATISTAVATQEESKTATKASAGASAKEEQETKTQERPNTPAPGSASARLAARRQAAQRLQQRSAATLITSEHFAYVRKDLIKIAVFAVFMFVTIIVLYLTLGRS